MKGIPKSPLSYAHAIREDPARKGLLYLGTENGAVRDRSTTATTGSRCRTICRTRRCTASRCSRTSTISWSATYGRGFWILDDLTPLHAVESGDRVRSRGTAQAARRSIASAPSPSRSRRWMTSWRERIRRTARRSTSGSRRRPKDTAKDSVTMTIANAAGADRAHDQSRPHAGTQSHPVGSVRRRDEGGEAAREPAVHELVPGEGVGQSGAGHRAASRCSSRRARTR